MAQILIYASDRLEAEIERITREEDRSVSYIIRRWIKAGLAARKGRPQPATESSPVKK